MKKTYILAVLLAVLLVLPPMTSLSAATQAQGGEAHTLKLDLTPLRIPLVS
ncbi:hypothetical protein SDC9_06816 [bioreactor metagenome]|uniref:Uncharacterized protein n=1 Tax=bioreactor metagenome TaxID=1076179 RepID=A0A644T2X7_9ZZZZ